MRRERLGGCLRGVLLAVGIEAGVALVVLALLHRRAAGDVISWAFWPGAAIGLAVLWRRQLRIERALELDARLDGLEAGEADERLFEALLLADRQLAQRSTAEDDAHGP